MAEASKTYVVECYVPGVDDAAVRRAADQAAAEVRRFTASLAIEYLGALLMAPDEVVLHAFRATDPELVARVSTAAGLRFDRVVESVEVLPARRSDRAHPSGAGLAPPIADSLSE